VNKGLIYQINDVFYFMVSRLTKTHTANRVPNKLSGVVFFSIEKDKKDNKGLNGCYKRLESK